MAATSPEPKTVRGRNKRAVLPLLVGTWLSASMLVLWLLMSHANTPGRPANAGQGPVSDATTAAKSQWTLVIFLHPHCPCSVASLEQAARLTERLPTMRLQVYLVRPSGCPEGWEEGRLSRQALAIPGVRVAADVGGQEARRCGAHTSGQVFLTDAAGGLRFRGGLTDARGHEGNSAGSAAVIALVENGTSGMVETAVFGCALMDDDAT